MQKLHAHSTCLVYTICAADVVSPLRLVRAAWRTRETEHLMGAACAVCPNYGTTSLSMLPEQVFPGPTRELQQKVTLVPDASHRSAHIQHSSNALKYVQVCRMSGT